jgi:hypothetical protein
MNSHKIWDEYLTTNDKNEKRHRNRWRNYCHPLLEKNVTKQHELSQNINSISFIRDENENVTRIGGVIFVTQQSQHLFVLLLVHIDNKNDNNYEPLKLEKIQ